MLLAAAGAGGAVLLTTDDQSNKGTPSIAYHLPGNTRNKNMFPSDFPYVLVKIWLPAQDLVMAPVHAFPSDNSEIFEAESV